MNGSQNNYEKLKRQSTLYNNKRIYTQQEDRTFINIYVPNTRLFRYKKQMVDFERDPNKITVFNVQIIYIKKAISE